MSTLVLFSERIRCPCENTNYNVILLNVSPTISPVKYTAFTTVLTEACLHYTFVNCKRFQCMWYSQDFKCR